MCLPLIHRLDTDVYVDGGECDDRREGHCKHSEAVADWQMGEALWGTAFQ